MFYGECINGCGEWGFVVELVNDKRAAEKVDRGNFTITGKAVFMLWESSGVSDEEREEAAREDFVRGEQIQEELGMTETEFHEAVMEEFGRLREGRLVYWSDGELLEEAARNVGAKVKGE